MRIVVKSITILTFLGLSLVGELGLCGPDSEPVVVQGIDSRGQTVTVGSTLGKSSDEVNEVRAYLGGPSDPNQMGIIASDIPREDLTLAIPELRELPQNVVGIFPKKELGAPVDLPPRSLKTLIKGTAQTWVKIGFKSVTTSATMFFITGSVPATVTALVYNALGDLAFPPDQPYRWDNDIAKLRVKYKKVLDFVHLGDRDRGTQAIGVINGLVSTTLTRCLLAWGDPGSVFTLSGIGEIAGTVLLSQVFSQYYLFLRDWREANEGFPERQAQINKLTGEMSIVSAILGTINNFDVVKGVLAGVGVTSFLLRRQMQVLTPRLNERGIVAVPDFVVQRAAGRYNQMHSTFITNVSEHGNYGSSQDLLFCSRGMSASHL